MSSSDYLKRENADIAYALWHYAKDENDRRVPLDELAQTPEFLVLTKKQKLFIATYIMNGYDAVNAIRTAYDCKDDSIAAIMQHRLFNTFSISMAMSRHFGSDPKKVFMVRLIKTMTKGIINNNQIRAYELYARLNGWDDSPLLQAAKIAKELGSNCVTRKGQKGEKVDPTNTKATIKKVIDDNTPDAKSDYDFSFLKGDKE
jgi:hypothetical protein